MESFLVAQPADGAEQQGLRAQRQAQQALQRALGAGFTRHLVVFVGRLEQRVAGRIPYAVIHTIQDTAELARPVAQHAIQAAALLGRRDLAGVARADRGQGVGKLQPRFHERQMAVVLVPVDREQRFRQAQGRQRVTWENALVSEVVNREDARRPGAATRQQLHVHRGQSGVPVVRMHHIGLPLRVAAAAQPCGRPAQEGEARRVVGPVVAAGVEVGPARTLVLCRGVQQVHRLAGRPHAARHDPRHGMRRSRDIGPTRGGQGNGLPLEFHASGNRRKGRQQDPYLATGRLPAPQARQRSHRPARRS